MRQNEAPSPLTPMQLECLRRAASTDKEIARQLSISPETVSSHIRSAMRRLGAANRREAMGRLTVHPLYGSIEIPNVQIVAPAAEALQAPHDPATLALRPMILGRRLPPLPGSVQRLYWVFGVFVGLADLTIIGLSLLSLAAQLIDRQALGGTL